MQDTDMIVELLKLSLGETTLPKSSGLWNWKHFKNPFGPSYILLAETDGVLVGVRAFMQWQWNAGNEKFNSVRAVDTATHPDYQGRGIFKKLTLQQASICKKDGKHFIFNSPNKQSQPGYLKMGWVQQGKMPIKFAIIVPFNFIKNIIFKRPEIIPELQLIEDFTNVVNHVFINPPLVPKRISTSISKEYILWRYVQNPLYHYSFFSDNSNYLLIYRFRKQKGFNELRIADIIIFNEKYAEINKSIAENIQKIAKENEFDFVSISTCQFEVYKKCFHSITWLPSFSIGPSIVLKNLNLGNNFSQLLNKSRWSYSIGDMELF